MRVIAPPVFGLRRNGAQSRATWNATMKKLQAQMFYQAQRDSTERDLTFLELFYGENPITDCELRKAIERRPALWSRYAGFIGQRVGAGAIYWGA